MALMDEVLAIVGESLDEHQLNKNYYEKFLRDNKVLAPKVVAYIDDFGPRPTDAEIGANHYAKALVLARDAMIKGQGIPPNPEPDPTIWPASYTNGVLGTGNFLPASRDKKFLSIFPGSIGYTWPMQQQQIAQRENAFGRKYDCVVFANPPAVWGENRIQWAHDNGYIPIIAGYYFGDVRDVAAGTHDAAIRAYADGYVGKPKCLLRLHSEFDNPNVVYTSVGRETAFVNAWKRIVDIFDERGADNVGFYLCPNEGHTRASADLVWQNLPDAYFDWGGVDWYNWCNVGQSGCYSTWMHNGWAEFWELFQYSPGSNFSNRHDAWGPRKPWFVGETNSVFDPNNPGKRPEWYRNVLRDPRGLRAMEWCIGVDFYDADVSSAEGANANFLIDSRGNSLTGFVDMARDPIWVAQGKPAGATITPAIVPFASMAETAVAATQIDESAAMKSLAAKNRSKLQLLQSYNPEVPILG